MHHKLLPARLLKTTSLKVGRPIDRKQQQMGEVSPTMDAQSAMKQQPSSAAAAAAAAPRKHVPLDFGLARIVSLELGSDGDSTKESSPPQEDLKQAVPPPSKTSASSKANKANKSKSKNNKAVSTPSRRGPSKPPQPLECPAPLERKAAAPTAVHSFSSHNHHQQNPVVAAASTTTTTTTPAAPSSASSLLAARMNEEQEILALYLQQRQQAQLSLQEQIQLEQLRRMQTAMLLYQHPQASALPYLESLLLGRAAPGAGAQSLSSASEMFPRAQLQQLQQQQQHQQQHQEAHHQAPAAALLLQVMHHAEPTKKDTTVSPRAIISTGESSGAIPGLLSLAPKRSLDGSTNQNNKPIKERPEEYQHLSKKAKRTPAQLVLCGIPPETTQGANNNNNNNSRDNSHPSSDNQSEYSDEDNNGQRFRPYQYEQWTEKFQELCDFRKEKGHCQVPHTYKENPALARWVKRQRYQYKLKVDEKTSTMTDERVSLLENIGFIWDSHAAAWAEKLHELKDFTERRGHCNVPSTFPENPQLATWVKCQRRQYKLLREGKTSNMTVDRIVELEKAGFIWEVRKVWDGGPRLPAGMEQLKAKAIEAAQARAKKQELALESAGELVKVSSSSASSGV